MQFLKILGRGLRDVYDQFAWFMVLSVTFWVAVLPVFVGFVLVRASLAFLPVAIVTLAFVPPALTTLFFATDPRLIVAKPEWSEMKDVFIGSLVRSWKIGLVTILPLIMIGWNIGFFAGTNQTLAVFVPLWAVMWVFIFILTFYMFCLAGTHESGLSNAFRGGMFTLVKYPFRSLILSLLILFTGFYMTIALLPMLIIGPALYAAIINRVVFDALEVYVIDPNSPTDERAWERAHGINPDKTLIDRVFRRTRDN